MEDANLTAGTSTPPPEQPILATTEGDQAQPQPLSKNAQKRLARAARIAEQKKERRAYEKEKKKEKKRQLAARKAAGELDEDDEQGPRKKARTDAGARVPFKARIVVDLGFDDLMSENEIKSLTSQLAFTYSANRKAVQPFESVLFTSLEKRTYSRLESIGDAAYKRWHGTEWWRESYERLWTGKLEGDAEQQESLVEERKEGEEDTEETAIQAPKPSQSAAQETVVYLTADSTDELSELKEGETYIIGGICDHNRYKNLCLNKSEQSGIRSARLPIGTYLAELKTRKVLTVNQTFEILLKWVETRDWKKALEEVVPKRKFNEHGKSRRGNKAQSADEQAEDEDGGEGEVDAVVVDAAVLEEEDSKMGEEPEHTEVAGERIDTPIVPALDASEPTQDHGEANVDDTRADTVSSK